MPITFWLVLFWCFGVTFLLLGCWLYSYFCWHLEEQFFFPTKQWVFSAVVQIHCYTKEFKANIARDQSQGHGCSRPRIFEASELCCRVVLDFEDNLRGPYCCYRRARFFHRKQIFFASPLQTSNAAADIINACS